MARVARRPAEWKIANAYYASKNQTPVARSIPVLGVDFWMRST